MISKLNSWAQVIIIAVIVGSLIQLLLPNNKNKKYIKMIIGIYILFCIINPVVGKSFNFNEYNMEKYINVNTSMSSTKNEDYGSNVSDVFMDKIKENINSELKLKGYQSDKITVSIDDSYNVTEIKISDIEEKDDTNTNSKIINEISISIKDKKTKGIAISDKGDIINNLSETYKIDKSKIEIQ